MISAIDRSASISAKEPKKSDKRRKFQSIVLDSSFACSQLTYRSSSTMRTWPSCAALISGVVWLKLAISINDTPPAEKRSSKHSIWPKWAALNVNKVNRDYQHDARASMNSQNAHDMTYLEVQPWYHWQTPEREQRPFVLILLQEFYCLFGWPESKV